MKKTFLLGALLLASSLIYAQKPAETNVAGNQYPAIYPDNRIEFRIKAPQAKKVQVDIGKKYDMVKGDDGIWKITTDKIGSGIHYYSMIVDGLSVNDPASETFYGCSRMMSCIEVPYPENEDQYKVQDIPHGEVRTKYYYSNVTKCFRKMYIYTPAGYDQNIDKKYPVLYIMHGGGEDARGWVNQGRGDIILDNLIAKGKAVPMIMVSLDANLGRVYDNVTAEIMDNVVPFIEKNYRVYACPEKRALAGLSMGGMYTLHVGVPRSDFFNYLGVFSSGWFAKNTGFFDTSKESEACYNYLENNKTNFNKNMKLFWIAMGSPTDIAYNNCNDMMKRFDQLGINYKYYESKEGGHTWPVWREDLFLFAPQLFR